MHNPRSLLHLDSETGAILSRYVAYEELDQYCYYPLLNSPSSLYTLCGVRREGADPDVWQVRTYASL